MRPWPKSDSIATNFRGRLLSLPGWEYILPCCPRRVPRSRPLWNGHGTISGGQVAMQFSIARSKQILIGTMTSKRQAPPLGKIREARLLDKLIGGRNHPVTK